MNDGKLYGMQREDQTVIQNALVIANDIGYMNGVAVEAGEPVVVIEIVAISVDRLRALEEMALAAERMIADPCDKTCSDYNTARAAVGEIGGGK